MRLVLTLLHRWVGLGIAAFLFVSGVTGAVISWDRELDLVLNPHLTKVRRSEPTLSGVALARIVEARDPRVMVTFLPLRAQPGRSHSIFVSPRVDPATGKPYRLSFNQIFLDPVTGAEIGKRKWGAVWPISTETIVSFLYVLHYTLHVPEFWGIDHWGIWLMGAVTLLWTLDCIVGFVLTLPARRVRRMDRPAAVACALARGWWVRWKPAWKIKTSGSRYRAVFDIHRAFGLWTWALLFTIAFTGISLNLYGEVVRPVLTTISTVTPSPFSTRARAPHDDPFVPKVGFGEILRKAEAEASRRGWTTPVGAISYSPAIGIYQARFYEGSYYSAPGLGPERLYYDGGDGRYVSDRVNGKGTPADIFNQLQYPLHSGRILGVPGRILVSVMGLVVAALSVTGVAVWYRKRRARRRTRWRRASSRAGGTAHQSEP